MLKEGIYRRRTRISKTLDEVLDCGLKEPVLDLRGGDRADCLKCPKLWTQMYREPREDAFAECIASWKAVRRTGTGPKDENSGYFNHGMAPIRITPEG